MPARPFALLSLLLVLVAGPALAVGDRGADGEFERRDSFHFTLHQDVDIDEEGGLYGARRFEQQLLAELEKAFDTLDRLLGLRPEGKLVVYVWDPTLFDREYAGLFRFPAAGFYGGVIHVRGGERILGAVERELGIRGGETDEALHFTLETVGCLGACALGPIVVVDGVYHGQMTSAKAARLLQRVKRADGNGPGD